MGNIYLLASSVMSIYGDHLKIESFRARGGEELAEEAFFFSQNKEQATALCGGADKRSNSVNSPKKVLVWVPENQGEPQEEEMLIRTAGRGDVAGVVYCGTLSQAARMRLCDHLVWEETAKQEIGELNPEGRGTGRRDSDKQKKVSVLGDVAAEESVILTLCSAVQSIG